MTKLSFSTMNALINQPHTWLNKISNLPRVTTDYFEKGKAAHDIIQNHVTGREIYEELEALPRFELVEEVDFDDKMRVVKKISDEYEYLGFVDGFSKDKDRALEIKTGRRWSINDFAKTPQWKLYAWAQPTIKEFYFVNVPFDTGKWKNNVRIYNVDVTEKHKAEAEAFIQTAITVIENIHDFIEVEKKDKKPPRRYCYYQDCPFGCVKQ